MNTSLFGPGSQSSVDRRLQRQRDAARRNEARRAERDKQQDDKK